MHHNTDIYLYHTVSLAFDAVHERANHRIQLLREAAERDEGACHARANPGGQALVLLLQLAHATKDITMQHFQLLTFRLPKLERFDCILVHGCG